MDTIDASLLAIGRALYDSDRDANDSSLTNDSAATSAPENVIEQFAAAMRRVQREAESGDAGAAAVGVSLRDSLSSLASLASVSATAASSSTTAASAPSAWASASNTTASSGLSSSSSSSSSSSTSTSSLSSALAPERPVRSPGRPSQSFAVRSPGARRTGRADGRGRTGTPARDSPRGPPKRGVGSRDAGMVDLDELLREATRARVAASEREIGAAAAALRDATAQLRAERARIDAELRMRIAAVRERFDAERRRLERARDEEEAREREAAAAELAEFAGALASSLAVGSSLSSSLPGPTLAIPARSLRSERKLPEDSPSHPVLSHHSETLSVARQGRANPSTALSFDDIRANDAVFAAQPQSPFRRDRQFPDEPLRAPATTGRISRRTGSQYSPEGGREVRLERLRRFRAFLQANNNS